MPTLQRMDGSDRNQDTQGREQETQISVRERTPLQHHRNLGVERMAEHPNCGFPFCDCVGKCELIAEQQEQSIEYFDRYIAGDR